MSTTILFDPVQHKYTNEVGNTYISATTLIGKYEYKFSDKENEIARACAKIGKNPRHPKYLKYKGMSASQILAKWEYARNEGCRIGNDRHDYLENSVKDSSGFYDIFGSKAKSTGVGETVQLYTIEDVMSNPNSGRLDLDYFISTGVQDRYPKIFNVIQSFVRDGWRVYSEVAIFHNGYLISGLIDILLVKGNDFVILDWKTNKDTIKFESGYWEKDNNDISFNYKLTDETFKYPMHKLPLSTGNKYSLQLSLYAYLCETFGLNHVQNILCHIRHEFYDVGDKEVEEDASMINKSKTDILYMPYLRKETQDMIYDYVDDRTGTQQRIF